MRSPPRSSATSSTPCATSCRTRRGPQTLRYAATLAGAIAVFELGRGHFRALHVVNVLLLLFAAAIASRASLIIAAIAVAGLAARHVHTAHVSARRVVGVLLLGLVVAVPRP